jgi:hypothetical protein
MSDQWKAIMIGAFALGGVFVVLDLTKSMPDKPIVVILNAANQKPVESVPAPEQTVPSGPSAPEIRKEAPAIVPQIAVIPEKPRVADVRRVNESELMGKEALLVLTDLDSRRDTAIQRDKDLFNRAIEGKVWTAYRGLLARSIQAAIGNLAKRQGTNRFDPLWDEPVLYQVFLRHQVLGKLTESAVSRLVTDAYSGQLLTWLCNNPKAMEEFLLTVKPGDDGGKVLEFLMEAWPNAEDSMDKYFPLALACAVVFDNTVSIPHPVGGESSEKSSVVPMERFLWYMEKNEKGLLAAPVHHSSASDLVWVVCAPVSTSELEWSLDKMHISRQHWGNAYGMIEYLMERAVDGLNPYKEYTFSEILKEGGICGDQSYFCANTARAQGIPAMTLSGETDLGGHAWVGLKVKKDEWTTGVGRIGGVSKGQTGNPQTGKRITEQEVISWNEQQSPVRNLAVGRHLWLAGFFDEIGNETDHAETVRLANQLGHSYPDTWAALFNLLKKHTELTGDPEKPSNLSEWEDFATSMRREFKDNPRMAALAATAESEYIFPYGDEGDAERAMLRERRRIARDAGEQNDLIAASLKREADLIRKRGDANYKEDISNLYDSAMRKYGGNLTGFKMMASDYFSFLKDDPELARKAARDIELAFKRVIETGSKEWFRANAESTVYQMICGFYRSAGDEDRAVMLEKRYETLLKRSKRGAL